MTVYDLPNVSVVDMAGGAMYKIIADDGWCVRLPEHEDGTYKKIVMLLPTYDFSTVQIIAESDLKEVAEIFGDEDEENII